MIKQNRIYLSLAACLLFLFANTIWCIAAETDSSNSRYSGKIVFVPFLEVSYWHDSNYYLDDVNEVSANTYVVKPGFKFGYSTPKSSVLLNYSLSVTEYTGNQMINNDDYVGHDLGLKVETQATDHLSLGIEDEYRKSRDRGSLDTLGNETNREKYQSNDISPWFFYAINDRWRTGVKYTYSTLDYTNDINEDSAGHLGTFNLEHNLNRTSMLNLEYKLWTRDYDKTTSDYTSHQIFLSYEKEFRLFSLTAGAGYHDRSFDRNNKNDFGAFIWGLTLQGDYSKTNYLFMVSRNFNDLGEGEQYYDGINIYTEIGRRFYEKINVSLSANYQTRDYKNSTRDEDISVFTAGLNYLFTDRLSLGFETGYERKDSNEATRDYVNKYLLIQASLAFDFAPR